MGDSVLRTSDALPPCSGALPPRASPADARWAPALLSRWEAVEERTEEFRASGVTTSRDDVDLIADFAYRKARLDLLTGQRFDPTRRN